MILLHDEGCDEKLNFAGKSDKGLVRRTNQDCFAVERLSDDAVFAVVCDGMAVPTEETLRRSLRSRHFAKRLRAHGEAECRSGRCIIFLSRRQRPPT